MLFTGRTPCSMFQGAQQQRFICSAGFTESYSTEARLASLKNNLSMCVYREHMYCVHSSVLGAEGCMRINYTQSLPWTWFNLVDEIDLRANQSKGVDGRGEGGALITEVASLKILKCKHLNLLLMKNLFWCQLYEMDWILV